MKRIFKDLDYFLGRFTRNECKGFSEIVGFKSESQDTMNLTEWQSYRGNELAQEDDWQNWMNLLGGKERRKFLLFDFLTTKISQNGKLLDIGCGQGHISILLSHAGYDVVFSEFDETVLPNKIHPYNKMFQKHDLLSVTTEDLMKFSDILLVQVDYIFNGETLGIFLEKCKKSGVNVHFINTQILGPFRFLKFKKLESLNLNDPRIKTHGYMRSVGFYTCLAHAAGYNILDFQRIQRCKDSKEDLSSYFYFGMLHSK